jgi:MarR family transcriptional regulator, 2-MHQ and catechol-resistance regulon repressor
MCPPTPRTGLRLSSTLHPHPARRLVWSPLRASSDHRFIVGALRARRPCQLSRPSPLTIRSSADYSFAMEMPDLKDDPYLKVLRPLVEAYLAFDLTAGRHIKSLRLTPSQFDIIATLGDTDGFTCSELSAHTLVTKGTLTGVLDRLMAKGLIRRDSVKGDRRCVKIRLTEKGDTMYRNTFAAHIAFIRPFFERALNQKDADIIRMLLLRLRDSFQHKALG